VSDRTATRTFGRGLARGLQVLCALQLLTQGSLTVDRLHDGRGPLAITVAGFVIAVASPFIAVYAETMIVRVGPDRIRWRDAWMRPVDIPFDRVQKIRKRPTKDRVDLETVDDVTLRLPVGRLTGWQIRRMVLGPGPASDFWE